MKRLSARDSAACRFPAFGPDRPPRPGTAEGAARMARTLRLPTPRRRHYCFSICCCLSTGELTFAPF